MVQVVQAENDEMINRSSQPNYIYENVDSDERHQMVHANSGHVITIDKEKNKYSKMYTVS